MPLNYDELLEEAERFLAKGERLQDAAAQHPDSPAILAAVDRYIIQADLLARALEEKKPAE